MPVFNNLVIFDPSVPQNSDKSIVPDLAESWSWNEDKTELSFKLRRGVKWHDGWAFTAADVECPLNLLTGRARDKLKNNPRGSWYGDINYVHASNDYEVTIQLNHPQPSLLTLLASGLSPIYPCHVPDAQMRHKPIGTGPSSSTLQAVPASAWCATPTTSSRASRSSTASSSTSSPAPRRRC